MNDLLLRAWALLGEDERPEGWSFSREQERSEGPWGPARWGEPRFLVDGHRWLDPDHVRDRLTLALERKLLRAGWLHGYEEPHGYTWMAVGMSWIKNTDQLTAACMAAESMGGGQ